MEEKRLHPEKVKLFFSVNYLSNKKEEDETNFVCAGDIDCLILFKNV